MAGWDGCHARTARTHARKQATQKVLEHTFRLFIRGRARLLPSAEGARTSDTGKQAPKYMGLYAHARTSKSMTMNE